MEPGFPLEVQAATPRSFLSLTSQADVDRAIAARSREVKRIEEEKRLLRHRRNALAPINMRLPPEVLSEIFLTLFRSHRHNLAAAVKFPVFPHAWMTVTFVCQYWRSVAFRTSRLWAHIIFTRADNRPDRIERISVWIARSGRLPLVIEQLELILSVTRVSYIPGPSIMALVMREAHRVKQLALAFGGPIVHLHKGSSFHSPVLNNITIVQVAEVAPESIALLRSSRWPQLGSVRFIESSSLLMRAFTRTTLTTLYVKRCNPALPVSEWLTILSRLPSLAELTLIHSVNLDESPARGPLVTMPALQYLYIEDAKTGLSSAQMLSRLAIPSTTRAHIAGAKPVKEADFSVILAQISAKATGKGVIGEPWVARICAADYVQDPNQVTLVIYATNRQQKLDTGSDIDDSKAGLSVTLALDPTTSIREQVIRTFYSHVAVSDVEGIVFGGPIKSRETFDMLLRPQMVRRLDASTHYLTGLRLVALLGMSTADGDAASFPYPKLSRLSLRLAGCPPAQTDDERTGRAHAFTRRLVDTLETRARHGLRLQHVSFTSMCGDDGTDAYEEDLVRLRALVGSLSILPRIKDAVSGCDSCIEVIDGN
ncbi:hypothetical protein PsYK624_044010 [Phanerochaete sordida]|uniref:F-box domain-containing protein n=1 Tax=Phanerochaete sordida TaxID=48140 RepID=A0A9P3LBQ0_9APHY|nr:hypothetical protein PsYK624_044010 [Phanerochaete sordida]